MTTKTIYVAGPMTGYENFNFPAFFAAEQKLRAEGWETINPAQHDLDAGYAKVNDGGKVTTTDRFDLSAALLWDLEQITCADAIYLLRGWSTSNGANAEHALAVALGKQVAYQLEDLPMVIGLGGSLRAGKDAVADHLVTKHGFVKIGMSDPLHEAMLALDPVIDADYNVTSDMSFAGNVIETVAVTTTSYSELVQMEGYTEAKRHPEVRRLLQKFGTEVGRNLLGENVWVDIARRRIQELVDGGKSVVLTGVRFPNEAQIFERLKRADTLTAWIERVGSEHPSLGSHASEHGVTQGDFECVIDNDGTLEDLYDRTDSLLNL